MTTKRVALGAVTGLLVLGIGAGVYAFSQNTNGDPRPFMGRGMGPRGPMGGPMGPGGPLGFLPALGRELGITDAQKDQIKNIAATHRDEWRALGDRARAAHQALQQAVTADTVDEALIRQRSAEVATVDADVAVARAHAHAEVFQILTAEQKAKARELGTHMRERLEQRRGRGAF
jgi:Spy/CpxP family protein refolding chaperone